MSENHPKNQSRVSHLFLLPAIVHPERDLKFQPMQTSLSPNLSWLSKTNPSQPRFPQLQVLDRPIEEFYHKILFIQMLQTKDNNPYKNLHDSISNKDMKVSRGREKVILIEIKKRIQPQSLSTTFMKSRSTQLLIYSLIFKIRQHRWIANTIKSISRIKILIHSV